MAASSRQKQAKDDVHGFLDVSFQTRSYRPEYASSPDILGESKSKFFFAQ